MKMSMSTKVVAVCGVIVAVLVQCMAAQTVHVVGDGIGWDVPSGGASAYANWASTKAFVVGDILTFNFTGGHDVVKVPKASFDSCSSANAMETITAGPANVTLTAAGDHFYICTIGRHCSLGQKLAVTVSSSSSGPSPPSTTTTPPPPTTTSPSPTSPEFCPPETSPSPIAGGPTARNFVPPPPVAEGPTARNFVPPPPPSSSAPAAVLGGFLFSMFSVAMSLLLF